MADNPSTTTPEGETQTGSAPYSQFYAGPGQLAIQTKANVSAPEIVAAGNNARAGIDAVSNHEMTVLTGQPSSVYRSNPTSTAIPDYAGAVGTLLLADDRDVASATTDNELALARQVGATAKATGLDVGQVSVMARRYKAAVAQIAITAEKGFSIPPTLPPTPESQDFGRLAVNAMLNGTAAPGDADEIKADIRKLAADSHVSEAEAAKAAGTFARNTMNAFIQTLLAVSNEFQTSTQEIHNGYGMAFTGDSVGGENYADVPKAGDAGARSLYAAWLVNPDDMPAKPPPGPKELGDFLVSLHESEHLSRKNDKIAPATISAMAQSQAGEIDADKAVMTFLDQQHDTASKNYWLQARQVDSFAAGVMTGNLSHDTATFLRVQQATGQQLDLDKFDAAKMQLLGRLNGKAKFTATGPTNRAPVADVMGAVHDVLADDKAQTDPSKKLSPMQRAEAQSFLADAQAMGYKANPNYPKAAPAGVPVASFGNTAPAAASATAISPAPKVS